MLLVERQALRLHVRRMRPAFLRAFVPGDAQPVQPFVDRVDCAGDQAVLIGVLDAQDQGPTALSREEVVVEDRAHAPDVEGTGGGWREAQTHGQYEVSLGRYSGYAWPPSCAANGARSRSANGSANRTSRVRRAGSRTS